MVLILHYVFISIKKTMGLYKLLMPKMGEGVIEATIIAWLKKEGETIKEDETLLEVATDKVDTEIQSPVNGTISKINFVKDDVVPVGEVLVLIETESDHSHVDDEIFEDTITDPVNTFVDLKNEENKELTFNIKLTPLVKKIIKEHGLSQIDINALAGTGMHGKVTRRDIEKYIEDKNTGIEPKQVDLPQSDFTFSGEGDELVEMDRMRKLIAAHMVESKRISPHVTSVVETDMTAIVRWRDGIKNIFSNKYNQKISFLPIIVEAVTKALKDFPQVNASVIADKILIRKNINIGIATALPNGNLIVPVIKNADSLNLIGLTKTLNDLVDRARTNSLLLENIQGGTFTITNLGTMGNLIGTPIINQPQVAILAVGSIVKKPAVIETAEGDMIGIRSKMYLSLSYDHRVVDGFLGGSFLKRISDYLEKFDTNQNI